MPFLAHFGLKERPFALTPNSGLYFPAESHQEVLTSLMYAIERGEGVVKVSGEVGTGKTLLFRILPNAMTPIVVDALSYLWVREYTRPSDPSSRWSVFDSDGYWLATIQLPDGFAPLDIGPDYVLGVWRDADDVEHVRMYELVKP
ncbi:MAG: hypothetical protein IH921_08325 [Gemmatimonadetes bacterium]|nr:hypothetical protein [Gemmatimonadota bacterium]